MKTIIRAYAIYFAVVIAGGIGWVTNIVKLCQDDFSPIGKSEIVRMIGIPVAPIGFIAGYITFDEEKTNNK